MTLFARQCCCNFLPLRIQVCWYGTKATLACYRPQQHLGVAIPNWRNHLPFRTQPKNITKTSHESPPLKPFHPPNLISQHPAEVIETLIPLAGLQSNAVAQHIRFQIQTSHEGLNFLGYPIALPPFWLDCLSLQTCFSGRVWKTVFFCWKDLSQGISMTYKGIK